MKKIKNIHNEILYVNGTGILPDQEIIIPTNELLDYISDENLFKFIGENKIKVKDGDYFIENIIDAWSFLIDRNEPAKTSENYWIFLLKNESELSTSEIFNFNLKQTLNIGASLTEKITIPVDKKYIITKILLECVDSKINVSFYHKIKINNKYYNNNLIKNKNYYSHFNVSQNASAGSTEILVSSISNNSKFFNYENNIILYINESNEQKYLISQAYDSSQNKIILNSPLEENIYQNTKLINLNSSFLELNSNNNSVNLNLNPYIILEWENDSYLELIINNINKKQYSTFNLFINGYFINK